MARCIILPQKEMCVTSFNVSEKKVIWRQLFPFNWNKARGSIGTSLSDKQQPTAMPRETDTRKAKTLIRGNSETLGRTFLGNNSIDIKYLEVILKLVLSDT